jgi:predicted nucleic acid-binding protein
LYADSSSILKLFLDEPGSGTARNLVTMADSLVTSIVAWPEIRAGLARASRDHRISPAEYDQTLALLSNDIWPRFEVVGLEDSLAFQAGNLATEYFLRGFDAIHLASAITLRETLVETITFASFDDRLNAAAADCGLSVP